MLFIAFAEGKGLTPSTIRYYLQNLALFVRWMVIRQQTFNEVAVEDFKRWLLIDRKNRPAAVNCRLRAVKVFATWAFANELAPKDYAKAVAYVRERGTLPWEIVQADVQKILDVARASGPTAFRDAAMIWLLWDTAIRPGELVSIELKDVNLASNSIRVRGKTGERVIIFTMGTRRALLAYLKHRYAQIGVDALFTGRNGEQYTVGALKGRSDSEIRASRQD